MIKVPLQQLRGLLVPTSWHLKWHTKCCPPLPDDGPASALPIILQCSSSTLPSPPHFLFFPFPHPGCRSPNGDMWTEVDTLPPPHPKKKNLLAAKSASVCLKQTGFICSRSQALAFLTGPMVNHKTTQGTSHHLQA